MTHIANEKWHRLHQRMDMLGIHQVTESFVLGGGSGGQKINNTHSTVVLQYNDYTVRCKKTRSQDANRYFARKRLCDLVSQALGIPGSDDDRIKRKLKQKKRRKKKSSKKYGLKNQEYIVP